MPYFVVHLNAPSSTRLQGLDLLKDQIDLPLGGVIVIVAPADTHTHTHMNVGVIKQ